MKNYLFLFLEKNANVSSFLRDSRLIMSENIKATPRFLFWIPITLAKIRFFHVVLSGSNLAERRLYQFSRHRSL